ncbi:MAG TPA: hypothetical protein VFZ54_16355 [Burkholderiales bacterium]
MEPFQWTRQGVAFMALMGGVALVVAVAAPFGSIALGAAALLALGAVLVKAMLRTRDWWPLTAVEGTIAASCLVLMLGGLGVVGYSIVRLGEGWHMTIGWPHIDPARTVGRTRAVSYSDPSRQQRLKDGLREAGVPFTVRIEDGKEFVGWKPEHDAVADAINQKVSGAPPPGTRNARIPDPALHAEFLAWLTQKGIKHEVVQLKGEDWVLWDESAGDQVRQFMEARPSADCKGKVAAGKSEPGRC